MLEVEVTLSMAEAKTTESLETLYALVLARMTISLPEMAMIQSLVTAGLVRQSR